MPKHLMEVEQISEHKIAVATGDQRELDGINLFDPKCPIEYVITVEALKEKGAARVLAVEHRLYPACLRLVATHSGSGAEIFNILKQNPPYAFQVELPAFDALNV